MLTAQSQKVDYYYPDSVVRSSPGIMRATPFALDVQVLVGRSPEVSSWETTRRISSFQEARDLIRVLLLICTVVRPAVACLRVLVI